MAQSHDRASELLAGPSEGALQLEATTAGDLVAPSLPGLEHETDPLSDVLRTVRLTGALFFLVDASSPWGIEVPHADEFAAIILPRAQHVVSYHIVLKGSGWASIPGVAPTRFEAGDILAVSYTHLTLPTKA
jgi:hypothetical protein